MPKLELGKENRLWMEFIEPKGDEEFGIHRNILNFMSGDAITARCWTVREFKTCGVVSSKFIQIHDFWHLREWCVAAGEDSNDSAIIVDSSNLFLSDPRWILNLEDIFHAH